MEPAEQGRLTELPQPRATLPLARDFLPDAEELESRPLPAFGRATLYLLLSFIVLAVLWAAVSPIDRLVMARGRVTTSSPTVPLQAFETSIVRKILVREGATVRKGDKLAILDPTFSAADITKIKTQIASLNAEIRRLEAEGADVEFLASQNGPEETLQKRLFIARRSEISARLRAYDERIAQTEAEIVSTERDVDELTEQVKYLREIEAMRTELMNKGVGSKLQMLQAKIQRGSIDRELKQAENHIEELRRSRDSVVSQRAAVEYDWEKQVTKDLVEARDQRDALTAELSKAARRREMAVLRAPSDGVVLEVAKLASDSIVREAEPVVTLVPLNVAAEAEVQITARDIGFVKAGDHARLKIDTFPFQKYGVLDAEVSVVGEDSVPRRSLSGDSTSPSEPTYLCRLTFRSTRLHGLPASAKLQPGMTLTAEIVVGRRTVLSYFLYPVIRTLDESMRER